ncbi:putative homogentisate 1,2-dioxygenase [Aspergillus keveii]|uniref:homogentisate 1,2-dioxygenase n=1 Tax=Aspergillus keveii TaxID=714993 RepID=A0ABR4FJ43_9EURO
MPVTNFKHPDPYRYLNGLGDYHESEAIPDTLPVARNSPQKPAHGLYTEKLSGTAFTVPRADNQHTWLYRILPSAAHDNFEPFALSESIPRASDKLHFSPDQLLFDPFDMDETATWVTGSRLVAGAGDPVMKTGLSIYIFSAGKDMPPRQAYYSADGDLLIVLQHGVLNVQTELGRLIVRPNEVLVVPRGIRYRVTLPTGPVRGYALELYQGHFKLPELGFIGSNGLANARDFQVPVAAYEEDHSSEWSIIARFSRELFQLRQSHSPFDVVAWHGLYYPYKYDLDRFNAIGSISYDHVDPSIYTVLTAPSNSSGTAVADFVIFPPRWVVQEDTFRPPWYHRNTMAEFSSMIDADFDLSATNGLKPAGATLHNVMSGHGPDSKVYDAASNEKLVPVKEGSKVKAFMFESSLMLGVSEWALFHSNKVRPSYKKEKWQPLKVHFQKPT